MLPQLINRYHQFREYCRKKGIFSAVVRALYKNEEVVPVEKSLITLEKVRPKNFEENCYLLDFPEQGSGNTKFEYSVPSRRNSAEFYLKCGYKGVGMIHEGQLLGDVWYVSGTVDSKNNKHPHVKKFGFNLAPDEVYMFDMFVADDQRKGGIATYFLSSVLQHLHDLGFKRAYGYFSLNNKPALWVHRILGYKELPHVFIKRILFYETIKARKA
jgi:GNAT superfamily N-acetyltransferase